MQKRKDYERVIFRPSTMEKMITEFKDIMKKPADSEYRTLKIDKGSESWRYDTIDEFLSELNSEIRYACFCLSNPDLSLDIDMWNPENNATSVYIESDSREKILRLSNCVDRCADECFIPPPPEPEKPVIKPKIFIGHGNSQQWRDLKDHLHDQHGYEVIAYETGSRAGHTIRDIVTEMLELSSFAILVMTGEDKTDDGKLRARQNVIHEIGLFQGHLGFSKAIVLKEENTEEFSNISGVHQIRYSKGNIKEAFGDVLSVLKREFIDHR